MTTHNKKSIGLWEAIEPIYNLLEHHITDQNLRERFKQAWESGDYEEMDELIGSFNDDNTIDLMESGTYYLEWRPVNCSLKRKEKSLTNDLTKLNQTLEKISTKLDTLTEALDNASRAPNQHTKLEGPFYGYGKDYK